MCHLAGEAARREQPGVRSLSKGLSESQRFRKKKTLPSSYSQEQEFLTWVEVEAVK